MIRSSYVDPQASPSKDCFAPILRAGRAVWLKLGLLAFAFWAWAFGLRPLARHLRQSFAASRSTDALLDRGERHAMPGMGVIRRAGPPVPRERARWSEVLANLPRSGQGPDVGLRARLPEVERAAPLRYLEADEDVWSAAERKLRD